MKTLKGRDSSGRDRKPRLLANLTSSWSVAFSLLRRNIWPVVAIGKIFKAPQPIIECDGVKTGVAIALGFLVLCGPPNAGQAQTGSGVVVWGDNTYGQTNVPPGLTNVIAIAAGTDHCLALKPDGTVVAWGENTWGKTNVPPDLSNVVAIAAGGVHNLALKSNGTVVAWGWNGYGLTNVPPGLTNVIDIAAGQYHSVALKSDSTVVAWGASSDGATNVPPGLSDVVAIAAGYMFSLAIESDGMVAAWGNNKGGQTNLPSGLSNVVAVAAGYSHSLALKSDGSVVAWGGTNYDYGQCVVPPTAAGALAIAAGFRNSMAIVGRVAMLSQPDSQMVLPGSDVQFQAQVAGVTPLTTQWFFNATNLISGATNAVLQLTNVQLSQAGAYTLVVSNRYGAATSLPATLKIVAAPLIVSQPTNQNVRFESAAKFSVVMLGVEPLACQWFFGTEAIFGATNSSLCLTNVQPGQAGDYSVVVTNVYGAATSAPALLTVASQPLITRQPMKQKTLIGDTVSLSVVATGVPPLFYQWFWSDDAILQATNATLQLTNVQISQSGAYWVVITNNYGAATSAPAVLTVYPVVTVTNCTEAALRTAMADGGVVHFACNGTIALTDTITNALDVVLDGSGHQVTISGNNAVRAFCNTTNASFTAINLSIINGASDGGSGILNLGGRLNLSGVLFCSNTAAANFSFNPTATEARGGAILNCGGMVEANHCSFVSNSAVTLDGVRPEPPPFTQISGGAIVNESGEMRLQSCEFFGNLAIGGAVIESNAWLMGSGYPASGGAIYNSGTMVMDLCNLTGNIAAGGSGSPNFDSDSFYNNHISGSPGSGGAIFNAGTMTVCRTTCYANIAIGGVGGYGSSGWTPWFGADNDNRSPYGLPGGGGGAALGGAIFNEDWVQVIGCTLFNNIVAGGQGGWGGNGGLISDDNNEFIGADGAVGGSGGDGIGGAVYNVNGAAGLINCTVAFNQGTGGDGGAGGSGMQFIYYDFHYGNGANGGNGGSGIGGVDGSCSLANCTIAQNVGMGGVGGAAGLGESSNGQPGPNGSGWGTTSNGWFLNTLMSSNIPVRAADTFTIAKLGPLTDNGGPTLTMALLPGSPAIDAGTAVGAPATDQRGVPRTQGTAPDIGAFEYLYTPVFTGVTLQNTTNRQLQVSGFTPDQTLTLQASTNLLDWFDFTNIVGGANGAFQCFIPVSTPAPQHDFFRLKSDSP